MATAAEWGAMKSNDQQKGFSVIEICAVLLVIALLGFGAWFVYQKQPSDNQEPAQQNMDTTKNTEDTSSDPKTYTSSFAKLSFDYPGDWSIESRTSPVEGSDQVSIKNPSGTAVLTWWSAIDGIGGACDDTWSPSSPQDIDETIGPCSYFYVASKEKLQNLDLYYVSGVVQYGYEDPKYQPWCALQSPDGVLTEESNFGALDFTPKGSKYTAWFKCQRGETMFKTKEEAAAVLTSDNYKAAKQILLSVRY